MTDGTFQGVRVVLYAVDRTFSGEWRVVSATARVTERLYIIDDPDDQRGFGYRARIPKDDQRVFTSAREAVSAAIRRAADSRAAFERKVAEANRDISKLGDLAAALDATPGQTPDTEEAR
jgi:hypothetical protein